VTKQELVETLYDFLLSLIPIKASAVLIIDEAQNLPLPVLEQIRILSNLETDKDKLLQIILVGQLNLQTLLRSPELRQLDQRVSIRYTLEPLDGETVAAYVAHRLTIAGGGAAVAFTAKALHRVYRWSGGIPRLINLICDRALLAAFSIRANRVTPEMVTHAAESLDVQLPHAICFSWFTRRASVVAAAAVVLVSSALAVGASAYLYERFATAEQVAHAPERPALQGSPAGHVPAANIARSATPGVDRGLPAETVFTILVSSFPVGLETTAANVTALTDWLEASGFQVFHADVDLGSRGRWRRVLAGSYTDSQTARRDADRLRAAAPQSDVHLVSAAVAIGMVAAVPSEPDADLRPSGTEP
jgi:general secretion pathway protein A